MTKKASTPALRFKGFTYTWKQRKLSDQFSDFIVPMRDKPKKFGGNIPWTRIEDIEGKYLNGSLSGQFVSKDTIKQMNLKIIPKDSLIVSSSATFGVVAIITQDLITNQTFIGLVPNDKETLDFWYTFFHSNEARNYMRLQSAGSTIFYIAREHFEKMPIIIPFKDEMITIGKYFSNLDRLITLHQRKYDKLTNMKKLMLEKMFPKNGANVPEIRFKGFTDAWEQRKLGEALISLQNNTLSRADLSSEEGIAKNIHYGDILVKFGEVIDVKTKSLPMISDETVIAKYKSSFLQNGDIIVADTAEDETVGKCTEIAGLSDEIVISGLHTIPYRPLQKYAPGYLGYYMNSASFHNQLLPLMQGIKVTSISKTALQNTDILYPESVTEQAAIGTYFRNLDNLITLHQRELEKLKNFKKACLEKMFV